MPAPGLATAQHGCFRDAGTPVPRVLLLGLTEERPMFKDLREKSGLTERKAGRCPAAEWQVPEPLGLTQKGRGVWGKPLQVPVLKPRRLALALALAPAHGTQNTVQVSPGPR